MSVTDHDRHDLYLAARDTMGEHPADVLMAMLPPVGWADVATKADIVVVKADIASLRTELTARIDNLETELTGRIDNLETELTGRIDNLRTELASLETRLTARIDSLLPKQVVANLFLIVAVLGLVMGLR